MVSTQQSEYVWGLAEQIFTRQITSGQVPSNTLFSPLDTQSVLIRTANVDPLLVDYNIDFMQVIYDYWLRSGNDTFLEMFWPQMVASTSYAVSRALDEGTQLFGAPYGSSGTTLNGEKRQALGPSNTVSMVIGLERMADMAAHLGHYSSESFYRGQAQLSRDAIESLFWNETGGYFSGALGRTGYDLMDIAHVLLAGVGTAGQRNEFIEKLPSLQVPAGHTNGIRYYETPGIVNPYFMSFLLEGLAISNRTALTQELLDATWSPMVRRDRNYTGAYWEYISTDGTYPGLDLFTGQSHSWGSYPPVLLSEYVLVVRPASAGYKDFFIAPLPDFKTGWVHGRVPTPVGIIYAAWGYDSKGKVMMEIQAPEGLKGAIVPPFWGNYSVDGISGFTGDKAFTGGSKRVLIVQD
ncbi:hypothetical protein N7448_005703 [Penicillium atrosanguineum]|uniref:Alpha-L-rhamnosidase C-terminal domain-containing protein n=1 Tax=Penicillium atrosanguineum TaxID=1132637 RepID=A0A9W9TZR4_9EURO|nr:uncharacterized protein N7443_009441 [Penicillium atrosanguineum]KAJ5126401.1 hypothetical protein N7526_008578 [Penicillium atrosanguineum]KAJ5137149.1 hypothetical protein N7448_005703 [Penicillium atrosanguineum]KAJ5293488.1 hypothetical protein N7443_009441 [Penicillium atrosanguineum]KAJ5302476.1 hypothetical protein N7476_009275 [Penicillium atrosanguineum]